MPVSPPKQTPLENSAQQLSGPGLNLILAARAVGVESHRQLLADAQKRTREGHLAMAKAAGMQDTVDMQDTGMSDDMGHLIVTGDISVQANKDGSMPRMPWDVDQPVQQPTQQQPAQPSQPSGGIMDKLKAAIPYVAAIAAGGGSVLAIPAIADWMQDDPPAVTQPAETPGVELSPGGLELEVIRPNP